MPSSDCLVHAPAHFLGFLASLSLVVSSVWAQVMKWRMSLMTGFWDLVSSSGLRLFKHWVTGFSVPMDPK